MKLQRLSMLVVILVLMIVVGTGCNDNINSNMATFNASATQMADGEGIIATPLAMLTPEPTVPPNLYDLTVTGDTLVSVWGQVYVLPNGAEFAIYATQQQITEFVIQTLQINGWDEEVRSGNVTIGTGQFRLDLAIVDSVGDSGSGTVTFQPTLDEMQRLNLNPQGAQFGTLQIPNGLTLALGDATQTVLTGAKSDSLSKVTLNFLSLEDQVMRLSGVVK